MGDGPGWPESVVCVLLSSAPVHGGSRYVLYRLPPWSFADFSVPYVFGQVQLLSVSMPEEPPPTPIPKADNGFARVARSTTTVCRHLVLSPHPPLAFNVDEFGTGSDCLDRFPFDLYTHIRNGYATLICLPSCIHRRWLLTASQLTTLGLSHKESLGMPLSGAYAE